MNPKKKQTNKQKTGCHWRFFPPVAITTGIDRKTAALLKSKNTNVLLKIINIDHIDDEK